MCHQSWNKSLKAYRLRHLLRACTINPDFDITLKWTLDSECRSHVKLLPSVFILTPKRQYKMDSQHLRYPSNMARLSASMASLYAMAVVTWYLAMAATKVCRCYKRGMTMYGKII